MTRLKLRFFLIENWLTDSYFDCEHQVRRESFHSYVKRLRLWLRLRLLSSRSNNRWSSFCKAARFLWRLHSWNGFRFLRVRHRNRKLIVTMEDTKSAKIEKSSPSSILCSIYSVFSSNVVFLADINLVTLDVANCEFSLFVRLIVNAILWRMGRY